MNQKRTLHVPNRFEVDHMLWTNVTEGSQEATDYLKTLKANYDRVWWEGAWFGVVLTSSAYVVSYVFQ